MLIIEITSRLLLIKLQNSRSNQRMMFAPPKLTVGSVFAKLEDIATMAGNSVSACSTIKLL